MRGLALYAPHTITHHSSDATVSDLQIATDLYNHIVKERYSTGAHLFPHVAVWMKAVAGR